MSSVYSTASVTIPETLPKPTGYHLLVVMPKVEEKTSGGILLPTDVKSREDVASIIGQVVSVGKDAYPSTDPRFSDGPWCREGDWVVLSKYTGHRFEYDHCEMRLINDDSVLATVEDPTKVSRTIA